MGCRQRLQGFQQRLGRHASGKAVAADFVVAELTVTVGEGNLADGEWSVKRFCILVFRPGFFRVEPCKIGGVEVLAGYCTCRDDHVLLFHRAIAVRQRHLDVIAGIVDRIAGDPAIGDIKQSRVVVNGLLLGLGDRLGECQFRRGNARRCEALHAPGQGVCIAIARCRFHFLESGILDTGMCHGDLAGRHVNIDAIHIQRAFQERKFGTPVDSCDLDLLAVFKRQGQLANMDLSEKIDVHGTRRCAAAGNQLVDLCFVEGFTTDDTCSRDGNNRNRCP